MSSGAADQPRNDDPARLDIVGGIAWIHLDDPDRNVNTLSTPYFEWFEARVDELALMDLNGLVLVSDKPGYFIVGADINELRAFSSPADVLAQIRRAHSLLGRFADLPFPVVVAIDGACLGGGLELSLACDYRVATTASHTRLGVPEVKLGLFPGLGGTQRLPRLIGVPAALDLILTGKEIDAKKALRLGLVDEICDPADLDQAIGRVLGYGKRGKAGGSKRPGSGKRRKGLGRFATDLLARTPVANRLIYDKARKSVLAKTGGHYPAPLEAIEVVRKGMALDLDEALELEAEGFSELVVSDGAKGLISIFFAKNAVEARASLVANSAATAIDRVAVLGAGFMGSGIAQLLSYKGIEVVLKDRDLESLGRGLAHCNKLFGGLVKRRKYRPIDQKLAMSRIHPTTGYQGFSRIPMVIEAVYEDIAIKHEVIHQVEAEASDDLVFASNTSTIPIARLAEASSRPEQFVGMHFFSPVHKMALLEIIKTDQTSAETLAATVAVGKMMGKTIIVVGDGPGFFTSRVLGPFLNEALWCLHEGASIEAIDTALSGWGWPVGPLALLDEVGLDIAHHAGKVMGEFAGDRVQASPVFELMVAAQRLGRKSGSGFYSYAEKEKKIDASVYDLIGWDEKSLGGELIVERCWMQMLNEVARCIEDGVIEEPDDIDIGVIFGFGFPPFRGGILREADRVGIDYIVGRLDDFSDHYGERLAPAQLLRDMAAANKSFRPS